MAKEWNHLRLIADIAVQKNRGWRRSPTKATRCAAASRDHRPASRRDCPRPWSLRASVTFGLLHAGFPHSRYETSCRKQSLKNALWPDQARLMASHGAIWRVPACYDQRCNTRRSSNNGTYRSHRTKLLHEKLVWMISEITKPNCSTSCRTPEGRRTRSTLPHPRLRQRNNDLMAAGMPRMARDILGANGIADDYPSMRQILNDNLES